MAVGSAHPANNAQSSATLQEGEHVCGTSLHVSNKCFESESESKTGIHTNPGKKFVRCDYQHLESSALLKKYAVIKFLGVQHSGKDSPGKDNTFGILTAMSVFDEQEHRFSIFTSNQVSPGFTVCKKVAQCFGV